MPHGNSWPVVEKSGIAMSNHLIALDFKVMNNSFYFFGKEIILLSQTTIHLI